MISHSTTYRKPLKSSSQYNCSRYNYNTEHVTKSNLPQPSSRIFLAPKPDIRASIPKSRTTGPLLSKIDRQPSFDRQEARRFNGRCHSRKGDQNAKPPASQPHISSQKVPSRRIAPRSSITQISSASRRNSVRKVARSSTVFRTVFLKEPNVEDVAMRVSGRNIDTDSDDPFLPALHNSLGRRRRISHLVSSGQLSRQSNRQGPLSRVPQKETIVPFLQTDISESDIGSVEVIPLLPRRISTPAVVPRHKVVADRAHKENALPSLPTLVIQHTPKPSDSQPVYSVETPNPYLAVKPASALAPNTSSPLTQVIKIKQAKARPSSLIMQSSALSVMTDHISFPTLPTQILKHTPQPRIADSYGSFTDSPCTSRFHAKTVWTMADEIALVRTGGVVSLGQRLFPCPLLRVVPLCLRQRNGTDVNVNRTQRASPAPVEGEALLITPVRSTSIPAHLVSAIRRVSLIKDQELGTPCYAFRSPTSASSMSNLSENDKSESEYAERYQWTMISNQQKPMRFLMPQSSGLNSKKEDVHIHVGQVNKRFMLTRANTLMKLKLIGAKTLRGGTKKLVGRGGPKF